MQQGSTLVAWRRRAPFALLSFRSVLLAVFVAALLSALTAAASPFVTTAVGSEALDNRLSELTPISSGLEVSAPLNLSDRSLSGSLAGAAKREQIARRVAAGLDGVEAPITSYEMNVLYPLGAPGDPVRLMTRTGALSHVTILSRTGGPGIWISSLTAELGHLKPGSTMRFGNAGSPSVKLRVKGVYRALSHSPQTAYWADLFQDIYPQDPNDPPPPSYVFVSIRDFYRVYLATGGGGFGYGAAGAATTTTNETMTMVGFPARTGSLTLTGARTLERRFAALESGLPHSALGTSLGCRAGLVDPCVSVSSLSSAVSLADQNVSAVKVPVSLLGDAGTAIALAVAAAAGAFLVRRRRSEAALAYARGRHVASFAGRTAVEALAPVLAGGAAGFAIAYALTGVLAPAGSTDGTTARAAALHAAVAVAIGLVLLVGAASLAFSRLFDTGFRKRRWVRFLPWEAPVLGVAIYLLVRIDTGHGLSGDAATGAVHPTVPVFVFPLLLVAGAAGILARFGRFVLQRTAGPVGSIRSTPLYLALRRLAAARGVLVGLVVVTATALGAFAYSETLASSLARSTAEKAYVATGSDAEASIAPEQPAPAHTRYPVTKVEFSNQNVALDAADGVQADVMVIDPATLPAVLHWQSSWGPPPAELLGKLDSTSGALPVVVTPDAMHVRFLAAAGGRIPVRVVGVVKVFPGMASGIPLVIASYQAMNAATTRSHLDEPLGTVQAYLWAKGPPDAVERWLESPALDTYYASSTVSFLRDPGVLLATRTYSFMRTVAVAAGMLVLLGLLLYLQARQKSQVIASVIGRRMGFQRGQEAFSVAVEVFAILAFAAVVGAGVTLAVAGPVVRNIDPLPQNPPSPIFVAPIGELLVAGGGLMLVAALAGVLTTWAARRADASAELRVA